MIKYVDAGLLNVAYKQNGDVGGWPVVLLHGFPYDVYAFEEVAHRLSAAGAWVVRPWLRGYGSTRFLSQETPRSGQQAALGHDLLALLNALKIRSALLAGFDWGGRAACIVSALWPERVNGLVSQNGYNIHMIAEADEPQAPETELRLWYQYYFHSERGRLGLERNRNCLCRLLWSLWSPVWRFDDATFDLTAASFHNPDFVEVVIHSYRHRFGLLSGDKAFEKTERLLTVQPPIAVPTITLDGGMDGVLRKGGTANHAPHFVGPYEHRVIAQGGHNLPQEMPDVFSAAIFDVRAKML